MFKTALRVCAMSTKCVLPRISAASVRHKSAYEGEGKTTISILNIDPNLGIMIDSFSTNGFVLNNKVTVIGPMALFPRTVLSWRVGSSKDVNEESLRLFTLLEPKVDLLIIGLESADRALAEPVLAACKRLKLNAEVLETERAAATYNFLQAEGRSVAAAMIPPMHVKQTDDDVIRTRGRYTEIES